MKSFKATKNPKFVLEGAYKAKIFVGGPVNQVLIQVVANER